MKKLSGIHKLLIIALAASIGLVSLHVIGLSNKDAFTVEDAKIRLNRYISNINKENNLPRPPEKIQQDIQETYMLIYEQAGSSDPQATVALNAFYDLEKGYKNKLMLLYPGHFSTELVSNTFITRYLAHEQIKAGVKKLLERRLGKRASEENLKNYWSQVRENFVRQGLADETFIDEAGIPLVSIDNRNKLLKEAKRYTKKHILKQLSDEQHNDKKKKKRKHHLKRHHNKKRPNKRWIR